MSPTFSCLCLLSCLTVNGEAADGPQPCTGTLSGQSHPSPNTSCHPRAAPFQESEWVKTGVLLSAGHQLGERRAGNVRGWLGRISGLKSAEQSFRRLPWMEIAPCFLSFFPEGSVLVLPLQLQNWCLGHLPIRVAAAQGSTGEWAPR